MTRIRWRIRLSHKARTDFARILKYTQDEYGPAQRDIYRVTLIDALAALEAGPGLPGSTPREEIHPGLRSLHVARQGRRGRHLIMYRAAPENSIEVVRILHDAMDLAQHLSPDAG